MHILNSTILLGIAQGLVFTGIIGTSNLSGAVSNGGFETGDFTNWAEVVPFDQYLFVTGGGAVYGSPHGGSSFAILSGYTVPFDSITQTLSTTAGSEYDISFWVRTNGDKSLHPDEFKASFGNIIIFDTTDRSASAWTLHTFTATATSASTVLEFSGAIGDTFWALDDVSVALHDGPGPIDGSPVPEPSAYGMLAGAILVGIAVRRRIVKRTMPISYAKNSSSDERI